MAQTTLSETIYTEGFLAIGIVCVEYNVLGNNMLPIPSECRRVLSLYYPLPAYSLWLGWITAKKIQLLEKGRRLSCIPTSDVFWRGAPRLHFYFPVTVPLRICCSPYRSMHYIGRYRADEYIHLDVTVRMSINSSHGGQKCRVVLHSSPKCSRLGCQGGGLGVVEQWRAKYHGIFGSNTHTQVVTSGGAFMSLRASNMPSS